MRTLAIGLLAALALMMGSRGALAEAEIGKPAPAFELAGSDGKTHKLSDYHGKTVVLYFHSTQCPWAKAYQPILNATADRFAAAGVVFLGVNSNRGESMDQVKESVKHFGTKHPILKDPGNKIADAYGGQYTPHVFVIDAKGTLRYVGGIEKAPLSPGDVGKSSEQYLAPVIEAIQAGKEPPQTRTKAIGCSIKREKKD